MIYILLAQSEFVIIYYVMRVGGLSIRKDEKEMSNER